MTRTTAAAVAKPRTRAPRSQLRDAQTEILELDASLTLEIVPGVTVRVKPMRKWRLSALTALKESDVEGWAKKCLASTEDYMAFMDADPEMEQIEAFITAMGEASTEGN